MTGEEHLAWCKKRALAYADVGDCEGAVARMATDIQEHPDTHINEKLLEMLCIVGMGHAYYRNVTEVRRWVEGFR